MKRALTMNPRTMNSRASRVLPQAALPQGGWYEWRAFTVDVNAVR
jgi:hypothetical protein